MNNWPHDSNHYQPLQEARQDAMKSVLEGDYDVARRYIERLERLYGPATGEIIDTIEY